MGINYRYLLGKGCELVSAFPSQLWDHIWFEPVQAVCMLPQCLWVRICISAIVSERRCFLAVIHPAWCNHLSASSSVWIIEPWGEVLINERAGKDIPFRTECWVPLSVHCSVGGFCASSHLEVGENRALLMVAEHGSDLWIMKLTILLLLNIT